MQKPGKPQQLFTEHIACKYLTWHFGFRLRNFINIMRFICVSYVVHCHCFKPRQSYGTCVELANFNFQCNRNRTQRPVVKCRLIFCKRTDGFIIVWFIFRVKK